MKSYSKINKGIVLIIVLWVLFFISIVVFTLGFKNRISIHLRSLSNEELRMFYLAKEGINRTIMKLAEDNASFDSIEDDWNNTVTLEKEEGILQTRVIDEDRFLNINYADSSLLNSIKTIFTEISEEDMENIYKMRPYNIAKEIQDRVQLAEHKLYITKSTGKIALYELITTFGDGKLNINTANEELLLMVPNMKQGIVDAIIEHRSSSPFESNETLSEDLSALGLTPAQVSSLIKVAKVNSSIFRIFSKATSARKAITKKLEVVVKRSEDEFKILYVKEN